jgi:hypothetical protein
MIMYLLDRLRDLSEGIVSDIRLHEQPTGLNPVQRGSLYAKKLTYSSKVKPPHSFTTATSSASAAVIRHRLGSSKGVCMYFVNDSTCTLYLYAYVLPILNDFFIIGAHQAHQSSTVNSNSAPASQVTDIVDHVISNVAKLRSVQCAIQITGS